MTSHSVPLRKLDYSTQPISGFATYSETICYRAWKKFHRSNKDLLQLNLVFQEMYTQRTPNVVLLMIIVIQRTTFNRPYTIAIN